MKFYSLSILFFLLAMPTTFAQVVQTTIVEHFTNTRCGACANRNPGFYENLEAHPDILHIAYHPSAPYSACLLSQHNPSENDGRATYYNVFGGTPRLVVQGGAVPGGTSYASADIFAPYTEQTTEVSMSIVQTKTEDQIIEATITITTEAAHNYTDVRLLVGVAEKLVNYAAPNGEPEHHDVFRKAMTDISGDAVTLPAVGDSISFTYSIANNAEWDFSQMFTYTILNDDTNKEIIQSYAALPSDNSLDNITPADSTVSSIDVIDISNNLDVYPNPVDDLLNIDLESGENSTAQVFDVSGKLLLEKVFDFQTQIDFSDFVEGMYFLAIENEEGKAVKKLLVE